MRGLLLFFSDEFSRRKRSKSEDMDSVQSKRRRYMEEEYEAEFQVKITAKGDINQKLQKVLPVIFQCSRVSLSIHIKISSTILLFCVYLVRI